MRVAGIGITEGRTTAGERERVNDVRLYIFLVWVDSTGDGMASETQGLRIDDVPSPFESWCEILPLLGSM